MPKSSLPPTIDTSVASIARVYNCFLGGKDNYEVDREVYRDIVEVAPEAAALAVECRRLLVRQVRYLATSAPVGAGVDQFIDLGCGLPNEENTHEVAQRINPDATVVYVDLDPVVSAYGRALLADNDRTHLLQADLRFPHHVLNLPEITAHIDFTRPIGLLQICTLHHLEDADDPRAIMQGYVDALPAGSYVALTHFYDPADGSDLCELAVEIERRFRSSSMGTSRFRTRQEIESYFSGLDILPASQATDAPAVGLVRDWWPDGPHPAAPEGMDHLMLCGLGRKP
ncbi:SAM-dependent methyltransferase [Saccharopolyspora shandongensis]|uniref:SAM-dependent methyltransferase n=1 Tax=Saccharopolyspora shandongensis TaxID=418495 RepID=UPI0033D20AAA